MVLVYKFLSSLVALAWIAIALVGMYGPVYADSSVRVIHGAGATFPYPIYAKWGETYYKNHGVKLTYKAIGSGGGIAQIKARTVDFGASDRPLTVAKLDKEGLMQFPMIVGGVVPVINVRGVPKGRLRLTPELLSDIFLGRIKKWNHRRIRAVNPGLNLPKHFITVIHRADGSGTTFIFTTYLSKVSEDWMEKVGPGKAVSWPTGVGAKGNQGITARVQQISGSIGYVEFAYALKKRLKYALLQNQAGEFVKPVIKTFQAAAENADWENAPGFYVDLTDQPGDRSWPITGTSFILMYKQQQTKEKAHALLKFFEWCYQKGSKMAVQLHYVPIPKNVYGLVKKKWRKEITVDGEQVAN